MRTSTYCGSHFHIIKKLYLLIIESALKNHIARYNISVANCDRQGQEICKRKFIILKLG